MFEKLKETLEDEWDITIVIGYRPYFEWIPSMWTQVFKLNDQIFQERSMFPWKQDNGQLHKIQVMFPHFYSWMGEVPHFSDTMLESASPHFPVEVLDLHDPKGVRSKFICDILKASASCEESLRLDDEARTDIVNKGSPHSVHYDSIGLEAAKKGYVNVDKWNRTDVSDSVEVYVEKALHQTAYDLPMICPDDTTMDKLFEKSLRYDKLCLPKQFGADPNREQTFRAAFQKKVKKKAYCHVDFEAVLSDSKWKSFFTKFG